MAAELGLSTSTQSQKLAQAQLPHTTRSSNRTTSSKSIMWKNKRQMSEEDDESWEVRAFEEDTTGNLMGCTWPPRSYTCTFCRREFRSAQALGGHMNVHRRDRARLNDAPPYNPHSLVAPHKTQPLPSTHLIPTQDLVANGLCLLYALPNPNGVLIPTPINKTQIHNSVSPLVSTISPFTTNKLTNFISTEAHSLTSSPCHSRQTEPYPSNSNGDNSLCNIDTNDKDSAVEELDLELRLGRKSPSPDKC